VKLRTALVLLLCASVGVHGFKLTDLVKMTPQGGLVNTWLYEKDVEVSGINTKVLCINTTEATDPCTNTIVMATDPKTAGPARYMSFGFATNPADTVTYPYETIDNIKSMKVTLTPKAGSSGIMASNSRVADLLNHDKDPMKTHICTNKTHNGNSSLCAGKLQDVWYSVFMTIRKEKDSEITFSLNSDDVLKTYQGKLSVVKITMCYSVSYRMSLTCLAKRKKFPNSDDEDPNGVYTPCNKPNQAGVPQGSTCASKKAFEVKECRHGTAAWSKNCPAHIKDGLQNAAAQRL